ncbi:MAG TPA: flavin reductase, partial [Pasteurellaceae bacterium]|nr:flavin reductase [Pasteurellaceae bacterium]
DGVALFYQDGFDVPLVKGCVGWLVCRLIAEPHNQQTHDLFIGEVIGAWADDRVFKNNHWIFDQASDELRTLHYVAGGQFFTIGNKLNIA